MYQTKSAIFLRSVIRKVGLTSVKSLFIKNNRYEKAFDNSMAAATSVSKVFWDIGANHGVYTSKFLAGPQTERIFCFEPNPNLVEGLKTRYVNESNVTIIGSAVSNFSGQLGLKIGLDGLSATSKLCTTENGDVLVKVSRFNDLLTSMERPDLIKIDIEGGEVEVLGDMAESYQLLVGTTVFIEIHFSIIDGRKKSSELAKILKTINKLSKEFVWVDSSHIKIVF